MISRYSEHCKGQALGDESISFRAYCLQIESDRAFRAIILEYVRRFAVQAI